jgi:probable rRNA maturation factor
MTPSEDTDDQDPPARSTRRALSITVLGATDGMDEDVRQTAEHTLRANGKRVGSLEIALVGDTEMRRQHQRWKGADTTTDVLSFDLRDRRRAHTVDGQLIVCTSVARRRARSRKTDWRGELLLYVVHGCLHLCGYRDDDAGAAADMHRKEDEILTALGWGPVFAASKSVRRGGS